MNKPELSSVLQHLRSLAENIDDERFNDQQLLERFLHHHEDAAFTLLMQRHSRLVLSAIRRVLSEEADVEDAFQATFLILLRRASSVRWQESIGNWLFGVAHRIAVRAAVNASKRRCHESEASRERPQPEDLSADLSWREALGLLHEELDRLPDKYRLPLLLCCLEGMGREEAAVALRCSTNAIKWRLEHGRVMLRNRLMRRGVTLSGALLAAMVYAPVAKGGAPALIQTTMSAAKTEALPASVAALMKAAAPAPSAGKIGLAVGILLTAILLAVAAASTMAPRWAALRNSSAPETQRRQSLLPAPEGATETVIVHGRVFDTDGNSVNGARLYSPHFVSFSRQGGCAIYLISRGISDADGRFRVALPRSDIPEGDITSFFAAADGHGVDWVDLPVGASPFELNLRMVKDQSILGRILNPEGTPVPVVVVALSNSLNPRLANPMPSSMSGVKTGSFPIAKPLPPFCLGWMKSGFPRSLTKKSVSPSNK